MSLSTVSAIIIIAAIVTCLAAFLIGEWNAARTSATQSKLLAAEAVPVTGLQKLNALVVLVIVLAATLLRADGALDNASWWKTCGVLGSVLLIGPAAVGLVNIWTVGAVAKAAALLETARRGEA